MIDGRRPGVIENLWIDGTPIREFLAKRTHG